MLIGRYQPWNSSHTDVSYPTAWLTLQKIMTAIAEHDAQHRLSGEVKIDDAYLNDERAGGRGVKRARWENQLGKSL